MAELGPPSLFLIAASSIQLQRVIGLKPAVRLRNRVTDTFGETSAELPIVHGFAFFASPIPVIAGSSKVVLRAAHLLSTWARSLFQ